MRCALDGREEELKKLGYVNQKAYFRIGRAIFIVEPVERKLSKEQLTAEVLETPAGLAITLAGEAKKLVENEETLRELQYIYMPTGYLKITVEGDLDSGFTNIRSEILLSGYRGGLDDVIIDGRLVRTVHGSEFQVLKTAVETIKSWLPYLEWYSKKAKRLEKQLQKIEKTIEEMKNEVEGLEKS